MRESLNALRRAHRIQPSSPKPRTASRGSVTSCVRQKICSERATVFALPLLLTKGGEGRGEEALFINFPSLRLSPRSFLARSEEERHRRFACLTRLVCDPQELCLPPGVLTNPARWILPTCCGSQSRAPEGVSRYVSCKCRDFPPGVGPTARETFSSASSRSIGKAVEDYRSPRRFATDEVAGVSARFWSASAPVFAALRRGLMSSSLPRRSRRRRREHSVDVAALCHRSP